MERKNPRRLTSPIRNATSPLVPTAIEVQARLVACFNEVVSRRRAGDLADVSEHASRWGEQAVQYAPRQW